MVRDYFSDKIISDYFTFFTIALETNISNDRTKAIKVLIIN